MSATGGPSTSRAPGDDVNEPGPETRRGPRRFTLKAVVGVALATTLLSVAGVAAAGFGFIVNQNGPGTATLACNGGVSHLSHVLNEDASIFPGDPETMIDIVNTIPNDFFLLENVSISTHTSTHLDAPGHFIEGGRTIDQLEPEELMWPAYIIDVRDRMAAEGPNFQLTQADIRAYEDENKKIAPGSMVIIRTGLAEFFGTEGYFADAPGFSAEAVQWMVDVRRIGGIGSDSFGPDATSDPNFDATFTILLNDRVALPGLTNLDSMNIKGDLIIASPVRLENGSGYQVAPIACHSRRP